MDSNNIVRFDPHVSASSGKINFKVLEIQQKAHLQIMKEEYKAKEKKEKEEQKAKEKKEKEEQKAKEKKEKEEQKAKEKKENEVKKAKENKDREVQKEEKKKKELWLKEHMKANEIWKKEMEFKKKIRDEYRVRSRNEFYYKNIAEFERYHDEQYHYEKYVLPVREAWERDRSNGTFPGDRVSSILHGSYMPAVEWRIIGKWKKWDAVFDLSTAEVLFEDLDTTDLTTKEELLKQKSLEEFVASLKSSEAPFITEEVATYMVNADKYDAKTEHREWHDKLEKYIARKGYNRAYKLQEFYGVPPAPKVPESAPKVPESAPKVPESAPKVPDIEPKVPDVVEPEVPDVVEPEVPDVVEPEVPDSVSEISESALDVSDPCYRLLFPNYVEPEVPDVEPEVPDYAPEVPDYAPEVLDSAPEVPDVEPEVPDVEPDVHDSAQEVPDYAPAVLVFAPEVLKFSGSSGVLSDVVTVALEDPLSVPAKVVQPGISKKRNKTHQNYLARQRKKQRKAKLNSSASVSASMNELD
jgi:hypothetical protein